MDNSRAPVLIAGAGIAGLAAALAFAQHGIRVRVLERAERLESIGAGLQLSPNATRLLDRLGVLAHLRPEAVAPRAIVLRDAGCLREIASVPLGHFAESRWGALYLTAHRADLQAALLSAVADEPLVALETGMPVNSVRFDAEGLAARLDGGEKPNGARLVVAADGVWSGLRAQVGGGGSRFSGSIAWRATVEAGDLDDAVVPPDVVSAFLHPGIHLVAYPIRAGRAVNLVAFTPGLEGERGWERTSETGRLHAAFSGTAAPLRALLRAVECWTTWPLHTVEPYRLWTDPRGLALIGDAAHAMTPFAAQGAAMAIEDAWVLAASIAAMPGDRAGALARYEMLRRPRVRRVAARGAFNRFTWHARGPVALARDLVLRTRSPARLAADLDWLYGWRPD